MKRITAIILLICLLLCGCSADIRPSDSNKAEKPFAKGGIWFSYMELSSFLKSDKGFLDEVKAAALNCASVKTEDVYIHVRPFCDSLFESKYFPQRSEAKGLGFDPFKVIIEEFHKQNIRVHAWINPYRVWTASEDVETINKESPAYGWLKDEDTSNDKNVCLYNGIYLNPAEAEVQKLVIDGIREIIDLYEVDGIHFDDYFYPTTDPEFDKTSYQEYCNTAQKPLSIDKWRRAGVNGLISGCSSVIRAAERKIIFSISPAASIDKNYNELYADVAFWVENGLVDAVIPQLYFGFDYPAREYRFEALLKEWKKLMKKNPEVELHIGLASYKAGTEAEADKAEWQSKNDIIARQVKLCREDSRISGYCLYSYSFVFSDSEYSKKQLENLKKYIEEDR